MFGHPERPHGVETPCYVCYSLLKQTFWESIRISSSDFSRSKSVGQTLLSVPKPVARTLSPYIPKPCHLEPFASLRVNSVKDLSSRIKRNISGILKR